MEGGIIGRLGATTARGVGKEGARLLPGGACVWGTVHTPVGEG